MINHLEHYDKLTTPNARMLVLRKAKEAIEEEEQKIKDSCVQCTWCKYLMEHNIFDRDKQVYTNPNGREVAWVECPICRQEIFKRRVNNATS